MCIPVHPFILGQPHRVRHLDRILKHIMAHDRVWMATGGRDRRLVHCNYLPLLDRHLVAEIRRRRPVTDAAPVPTMRSIGIRRCRIAAAALAGGRAPRLLRLSLFRDLGHRSAARIRSTIAATTARSAGCFRTTRFVAIRIRQPRRHFSRLDLLDRHRLPVTVAANAGACEQYPYPGRRVRERGFEFAAHGAFATRMLSSQMRRTRRGDRNLSSGSRGQPASARPAGSVRIMASPP